MPRWVHCQNKKEEEEGKQRKQLSHTVALRRALLLGINTFGGGKKQGIKQIGNDRNVEIKPRRCGEEMHALFLFIFHV